MKDKFKALLLEEHEGRIHSAVKSISSSDLPKQDVVVKVDYSTLNYKDALIMLGIGQMVKNYPIVPGIDFAGEVIESNSDKFKSGDRVILTGWRHGEIYWGGYAQYASASADHLIRCPDRFTTRQAMAIGTAGLTAALALLEMQDHGLTPQQGPVIVTGATGGVGSVAISLLSAMGYNVVACTGRPQLHRYLRELGAVDIVDRKLYQETQKKLLNHEKWAGAIDSVGSTVLANIIAEMRNRATVAACGLAGGSELPTNLMPFLLRGVRVIGIASADCPMPMRMRAWDLLDKHLPLEKLQKSISECGLKDVFDFSNQMMQGLIQGRIVVDVNR